MRESSFWRRIKKQVEDGRMPGAWQRVECKYPLGWPDAAVLLDDGRRFVLVELKSVDRLSALPAEVRPEQALFARKWKRNGGECYLYVLVANTGQELWFDSAFDVRQGRLVPLAQNPLSVPCPRSRARRSSVDGPCA